MKRRKEFGNTIDGFSFLGSSPTVSLAHQQAQQCCVCVQVVFVNADNTTGCLTLTYQVLLEKEKKVQIFHISLKSHNV
jgi:hypothetical protein